jgi:hypothetical protein
MSASSSAFFLFNADPPLAMETNELARALVGLGCPPEKSEEMAAQLEKRARQLATHKGDSYEAARAHGLHLMLEGWAAKERGL